MELKPTLIELERRLWRAAGDRDRYADDLADDAVHVLPGWGVADREEVLGGVADADPWADFAIDEPQVIRLDDGAAALVYTATAHREGGPEYAAAITSVYRRDDDGAWRLVVHQQTPL
jgi:ketosteroid isomerase-like protein